MIVEDEAIVALDIRNRLTSLGYEVAHVASSGEDALAFFEKGTPDLVLMDIMLDGELDGIQTADIIRSSRFLPIIYLTAYADEATLDRAKVTDPFGYIIKPFEDRELAINIEMALYKHSLERKVRDNERLLSITLKSIGDGVVTTDKIGHIQFMNPVAEMLMCSSLAEMQGKRLADTLLVYDEESGEPVDDFVGSILGGNEDVRFLSNHLLVTCGGKSTPITVSISAIMDEVEGIQGAVLVFRDITKRKQAENALRQSVSQLKRTLEETVNALVVTSEKRDPYTAGHQQRVAHIASAIAQEMGLSPDMVEGIRVAGLLHDIGKIYVPAEILSKPAKLTDMEMGLIKTHSEVGYDILKQIPFPWPVAEIVLQHHERIDGSGYPQHLHGDAILPEAKIICVADVVEAMTSHRPYRAALGQERALAEVEKHSGKLYDKDVCEACKRLFEKGFRQDIL